MALKSVSLSPGECIVLPAGAVIDSIVVTGTASVTSTCGTLPTPVSYKCGFFSLLVDNDANTGHSMDEGDTNYVSLRVGDTTYMINEPVVTGSAPGVALTFGSLNLHITDLGIFEFKAVTQTDLTKRSAIWVYFQVPESLYDDIELKVSNHGVDQYHKPYDATCGEYPVPS